MTKHHIYTEVDASKHLVCLQLGHEMELYSSNRFFTGSYSYIPPYVVTYCEECGTVSEFIRDEIINKKD